VRLLCPLLLVVGVGLMIPFEATVTRVFGVAALLAFVACGVFAIATPEYLARDDDD
jgi:hypothetical protein